MVETSQSGGEPPQRPGDAAVVADVTELLRELSFAVARQHHWLASQLSMHDTDLSALMLVHDLTHEADRPPSIGDVADQLGLSSPAATALVDRLVAAGHLERVRDPSDRRRVLLRATSASYGAVAPLLSGYLERLDDALSAYGDEDLAVVRSFLATVLEQLEATLDDDTL